MISFPIPAIDGQQFVASNGASYTYIAATNRWQFTIAPANSYYTRAQADAQYLKISGGSLTGRLTLAGNPTTNNDAATKQYVDSSAISAGNGTPVDLANYLTVVDAQNTFLSINGGVVTSQITSPEPLYPVHLATKNYVDINIGSAITQVNSAQFLTQNQANLLYAPLDKVWPISSIDGLQQTINTMITLGGGQLNGTLYLYQDPIADNEAATKNYVDVATETLNTAIGERALTHHTHEISDVENLQAVIDTLAPLNSTWNITSVTGLQATLSNKIDRSDTIPISMVANLSARLLSLLPYSGGQMTGNLILNGDPSQVFQASTKHYVDQSITNAILTLPTSTAIVSTSPPPQPIDGNLWWDSANGILYIYYDDGTTSQFVPTTPSITSLGNYFLKTGGVINGQTQISADFSVLDSTLNHGIRARGGSTNGGFLEAYNVISGVRETLALSPNGGSVTVPNATGPNHALNRQTGDARYALLTGSTFIGPVVFSGSATFNAATTLTQPLTLNTGNLNVQNADISVSMNSLPMSLGATGAHFSATSADSGASLIFFERTQASNASSTFIGLDSDNFFKIGGGAWNPAAFKLDSAGNLTAASSLKAPSIFCDSPLITDAFFGLYTTGQNLLVSFMNGYDLELNATTGNYSLKQNGTVILSTSAGGCLNITGSTPQSYTTYGYINSAGVATQYSGTAISKAVSLISSAAIVATEFDAVSDARIKTDVISIDQSWAESFIKNTNPVSYQFRYGSDKRRKFGYIAQDMLKSGYNELVSMVDTDRNVEFLEEHIDHDGFLSPADKKFLLSMDNITPLHGAALKSLFSKIEYLEHRIKTLETK